MLNNWQSERAFGETFSVLRTKTFLVRSIGEPVRSVVSTGLTAATCKIPKGTCVTASPISCSYVFAGFESRNCFCRRNSSPRGSGRQKAESYAAVVRRSREKNASRRARLNRALWAVISATWQSLTKSRHLAEWRPPDVSLTSNDSVGIFQRIVRVSANFRALMKTARC